MLQGFIDIRNKANELAKKSSLGILEPYTISCSTLIAILDELEAVEQRLHQTEGSLRDLQVLYYTQTESTSQEVA